MSIPLKAKVAIRDLFTSEDSDVKKTFSELKTGLGIPFVSNPDWALLVADLSSQYEDKASLVTAIVGCLNFLGKAFLEIINDEDNYSDWIEELLDNVQTKGQVEIEISVAKQDKPSVTYSKTTKNYTLFMPSKQVISYPAEFFPIFKAALVENIENLPDTTPSEVQPAADEWTDIEVVRSSGRPAISTSRAPAITTTTSSSVSASASASGKKDVEILPNVNSLPRADMLLLGPPYHMTIVSNGSSVDISCSHSPTLEFLNEYLKKWCRGNIQLDKSPPLAEIELQHSPWGLGSHYDTLVIKLPHSNYGGVQGISHVTILHLVESVLGYKMVYTSPRTWHYRKDTPLRKV